ncbi:hypothetical protein [uncultured Mailhella sp.]|uniref:hypothetical protein n=1 Tax=uncultured Mailhella sp. TaxID=1981031 RepID=UPI0025DD0B06|nr:hypothetical protein [uncultured Mailhella sp.]
MIFCMTCDEHCNRTPQKVTFQNLSCAVLLSIHDVEEKKLLHESIRRNASLPLPPKGTVNGDRILPVVPTTTRQRGKRL